MALDHLFHHERWGIACLGQDVFDANYRVFAVPSTMPGLRCCPSAADISDSLEMRRNNLQALILYRVAPE
jgi:hypothetical protein